MFEMSDHSTPYREGGHFVQHNGQNYPRLQKTNSMRVRSELVNGINVYVRCFVVNKVGFSLQINGSSSKGAKNHLEP